MMDYYDIREALRLPNVIFIPKPKSQKKKRLNKRRSRWKN